MGIHIRRARFAAAVWASFGLLGIAVAMHSMVGMAASTGVLTWAQAPAPVGQLMVRFVAGVSLAVLALWGIYKRTVHHKRDDYSA
jgi:hypothetical protein